MSGIIQFGLSFSEYLIRQNLLHMIVHVTNHCNFRCDHCFIDFSKDRDLKLDAYQRLARDAGRLFWVDIGGGEPFLRKDLAKIVEAFDARVVTIPSNGSLPDQMEEQLTRMHETSNAELVLSLSIDGLEKTHDTIRNQPGSWNQVWETFERLNRLDWLTVKINTVLTTDNDAEILNLMKEVKRREPNFHSIILLRGDPADPETKLPSMPRLRQLGPEIFAILETYDYGRSGAASHILRNYQRYQWNVSLKTIEEQRQVVPCIAGKGHLVIMGDGGVSSCEMLPVVGNITEQSLSEIKRGPAFLEQRRSIANKECHCTHNCAMLHSIFFNPASLPHFVRTTIDS